jgi:hypothetical protein
MFFAAAQNVCFWHKADVELSPANVRFWGNSGHSPQWLSHTFKISPQMRESRVDQFLIQVNFIGLMR